jgi:hypothetical protein
MVAISHSWMRPPSPDRLIHPQLGAAPSSSTHTSTISTAKRTSSSRRPISSTSVSAVRATKLREMADLLVDRSACSTWLPIGSWMRW